MRHRQKATCKVIRKIAEWIRNNPKCVSARNGMNFRINDDIYKMLEKMSPERRYFIAERIRNILIVSYDFGLHYAVEVITGHAERKNWNKIINDMFIEKK